MLVCLQASGVALLPQEAIHAGLIHDDEKDSMRNETLLLCRA